MSSLRDLHLNSNPYFKINFKGGELSSDSGLLLFHEFLNQLAIPSLLAQHFNTDSNPRMYSDTFLLLQQIYQTVAGYFQEDDADELAFDPIFTGLLSKERLASQPTMSRFMNRLDEICLMQWEVIQQQLREKIYAYQPPKQILLDIDSTSFATYGSQEGSSYNAHYQTVGYHPIFVFDGITKDLLKAELRPGNTYTSKNAASFLLPLLLEYLDSYPQVPLFLRGDSGFADVMFYELLESHGVSYVIRMKESARLRQMVEGDVQDFLTSLHKNQTEYACTYTEFWYCADSWAYPRRIVCKIELQGDTTVPNYTFLVTNMELSPLDIVRFYSHRGTMENMIKEVKSGFHLRSMPSHRFITNQNRLQVGMLAYNLFHWFRRMVLPEQMRHLQIDTIRFKLIKIAAKRIKHSRYQTFQLCSSYPYKEEFVKILSNIHRLQATVCLLE